MSRGTRPVGCVLLLLLGLALASIYSSLGTSAAAAGNARFKQDSQRPPWEPRTLPRNNSGRRLQQRAGITARPDAAAAAAAGTGAAAAAPDLPLPGYVPRPRGWVPPSAAEYLGVPSDAYMAAVHSNVRAHLASDEFKVRREALAALEPRGILVCAGGPKLVTSLAILLRVLRRHLNYTLPVEVAWYGGAEMDPTTLGALQRHFGPLVGTDLTTVEYPKHHRPGLSLVSQGRQRFVGKAYALLHCRFREVLVLDADSLPLAHPEALFASLPHRTHGNQFWPDAWANWVKDGVYPLLGLNAEVTKRVLGQGKGFVQRDAETGQLLLDRHRHADVLEHLWFINSFFDKVYDHVHGDKDTFALAFALAGKAHEYNQMSVPPGCLFHWGRDVLEVKGTQRTEDGWQLLGFLQYDAAARPAFFHRTMDKWSVDFEPWPVQAVTGPLPVRWARYYLAHDSQGPTKGVSWQHVVPRHALALLHLDPPVRLARAAAGGGWTQDRALDLYVQGDCPLLRFLQLQRWQALGLPVDDLDAATQAACRGVAAALAALPALPSTTNPAAQRAEAVPLTEWPLSAGALMRPEFLEAATAAGGGTGAGAGSRGGWEHQDATPLAALRVGRGRVRSRAMDTVQRAYDARLWLRHHRKEFPLLTPVAAAAAPVAG